MRLPDDTEITYSDIQKDGFHHAKCVLPKYEWSEIFGYTDEQMEYFKDIVESGVHLIIRLAECKNDSYFNS